MKSKKVKKISIIVLTILVLILIIFAILSISKITIVKNILKNAEKNLGEQKNFHIVTTAYTDSSLTVWEYYANKNNSLQYLQTDIEFDFNYNTKPSISFEENTYYNGKTEEIYNRDSEGKLYLSSSSELILSKNTDTENNTIVNFIKDSFNTKYFFKYSIDSEKIRDIDCYKIEFSRNFLNNNVILYIEKDTGLLMRTINIKEGTIFDYYYEFDTVTNETFNTILEKN